MADRFNIYITYYESFLALSVSIRVDRHQLMMERTPSSSQAPVLRYRDITFTTEYLKESLSASCPLLGVHNVARVRQGATLPLVEVDFTDEKALERFCKSISSGAIQSRLQDRLGRNFFGSAHEIDVTVKLHLIMPNTERKSPVSREVTTANYRECFSLIRESALFEFGALDIAEKILCIDDLPVLLRELTEVAANWFAVGIFLKIVYGRLEAIKNDNCGRSNQSTECLREMLATWLRGTDASPAALVQALRSAGRVGLAKKMAVKYGVAALPTTESEPQETSLTADLLKAFGQFLTQDSRAQPIPDLNALASQRERIATKDREHSALNERLRELKQGEEKVTETLEQAKLSLKSAKNEIDKLKLKQDSLIEKMERKESSRQWLVKQKASKSGADLVQLNQLTSDTEEAIAELTNQIDELEERIKAQNERVNEMTAQLAQKEQEKKQLVSMLDEVHKEKKFLESKLEEDRGNFEKEMQRMMYKQERELNQVSHEGEMQKMKYEQKIIQEEEKRRHENEMSRIMLKNMQHKLQNEEEEKIRHEIEMLFKTAENMRKQQNKASHEVEMQEMRDLFLEEMRNYKAKMERMVCDLKTSHQYELGKMQRRYEYEIQRMYYELRK